VVPDAVVLRHLSLHLLALLKVRQHLRAEALHRWRRRGLSLCRLLGRLALARRARGNSLLLALLGTLLLLGEPHLLFLCLCLRAALAAAGSVQLLLCETHAAGLGHRHNLGEHVLDGRHDEELLVLDAMRLVLDQRALAVADADRSDRLLQGRRLLGDQKQVHGHILLHRHSLPCATGMVDRI
jgi:hypothetical protein